MRVATLTTWNENGCGTEEGQPQGLPLQEGWQWSIFVAMTGLGALLNDRFGDIVGLQVLGVLVDGFGCFRRPSVGGKDVGWIPAFAGMTSGG